MRDLANNIHTMRAISPVVATDNTALVSEIIDRRDFGSLAFVIQTGTLADSDATFAVLVEHDDAGGFGTAVAVPDNMLNGTEALAGFTVSADNVTRKIGYVGEKRYVRLTITPSGNSGNAPIAAVAILGHPARLATANPPA